MKDEQFKEITGLLIEILDSLKAIEYAQSSCFAVVNAMRADQISGRWDKKAYRLTEIST